MRQPVALGLYDVAARIAEPGLRFWLARRAQRGKEIAARLPERHGIAAAARPDGTLVWVHAASMGETMSVLPLIAELTADASVLLTTGTVTSADLAAERLPPGAIHQFVPLDVPAWIGRFLTYWHPEAAVFVESEIWPNSLEALTARQVPVMLVNGRMSARSAARWQLLPTATRAVLRRFRWIAAQSAADAAAFSRLSGLAVDHPGNLKFAAPTLPDDPVARTSLAAAIPGPVWLAAATHTGEDEPVIAAHRTLAAAFPSLVTMIAPRHPARGAAIAALAANLPLARRSRGEMPVAGGIYIADTLGELGIFYRLSPIAFIGGSLVPVGGHNMLEAAKLGCAMLSGPHTENFIEPMIMLRDAGALVTVQDGGRLAEVLRSLLADPARVAAMGEAGRNAASRFAGLPRLLASRIRAEIAS